MMPHDFPPWGTVHFDYRQWRLDGTRARILDVLRTRLRHADGRRKSPSAAIVDSQSVKTAEKGGHAVSMLARKFRDASAILSSIPWD